MKEILKQAIENLKGFSQEQWLWLALAGLILGYIVYNRKQYVDLFKMAVIASEESFSYGDNKKKLDAAINYINFRTSKLPIPARIIITKFLSRKRIIRMIEKTLQKFSDVFANGIKINIKGKDENGAETKEDR